MWWRMWRRYLHGALHFGFWPRVIFVIIVFVLVIRTIFSLNPVDLIIAAVFVLMLGFLNP